MAPRHNPPVLHHPVRLHHRLSLLLPSKILPDAQPHHRRKRPSLGNPHNPLAHVHAASHRNRHIHPQSHHPVHIRVLRQDRERDQLLHRLHQLRHHSRPPRRMGRRNGAVQDGERRLGSLGLQLRQRVGPDPARCPELSGLWQTVYRADWSVVFDDPGSSHVFADVYDYVFGSQETRSQEEDGGAGYADWLLGVSVDYCSIHTRENLGLE